MSHAGKIERSPVKRGPLWGLIAIVVVYAVSTTYQTGQGARVGSYGDGMVWVGNSDEGTVMGIDVVTGLAVRSRTAPAGAASSDGRGRWDSLRLFTPARYDGLSLDPPRYAVTLA
jgi:hypothetical protein